MIEREPNELDAWEAASLLARRELSAVDMVRACLARIELRDGEVHAFQCVAAEAALAHARSLDSGAVRGLLHGLPLGIKDIFDAVGMPATYGSPIYAQHFPVADAAVVALCKAAGGIALGKTVTTEFAAFEPGPTRNPHRLDHTPGGSSSGSAAAVAAHMVPLALGTQTAGSIIRPAAFCGVVGYKPSVGRVPRVGLRGLTESFDSVGGFGRSVRDVGLLGAVLLGDKRLAELPDSMADAQPRIGFCHTDLWVVADDSTRDAWALAVRVLDRAGVATDQVELPDACAPLCELQQAVLAFEAARNLADERLRHPNQISARLQMLLDEGVAIDGARHAANLARVDLARREIEVCFEDVDALLAPSTIGEAPLGLESTGDPVFCRYWSLLGLPCVHLPFTRGVTGLPVGLQLIGRHGDDRRLLALAHWLLQLLQAEGLGQG